MEKEKQPKPFEIYRKEDYRDYGEHGIMQLDDLTPAMVEGLTAFENHGASTGQQVRMAYSRPGMSLTHVWFKSGYPLPLHSHTSDCLYYILAGSIRVGSEEMGAGDGFFVGADVPYTYETGPNGAEVLEFRSTDFLNIRFMAKSASAWEKTVAKVKERREDWQNELPPSQAGT